MLLHRSLVTVTLVAFLLATAPAPATAAAIGTGDVAASARVAAGRAGQIEYVRSVLDRAEVRAALEQRGVDPAAAAGRVAALSDQELAELAGQLDALPAGGDLLAVIGIVFVVLLILELTGVIDIFKKL